MKVRTLQSFAADDTVYPGGVQIDVDAKRAKELITAGLVEPVGRKPVEKAERR